MPATRSRLPSAVPERRERLDRAPPGARVRLLDGHVGTHLARDGDRPVLHRHLPADARELAHDLDRDVRGDGRRGGRELDAELGEPLLDHGTTLLRADRRGRATGRGRRTEGLVGRNGVVEVSAGLEGAAGGGSWRRSYSLSPPQMPWARGPEGRTRGTGPDRAPRADRLGLRLAAGLLLALLEVAGREEQGRSPHPGMRRRTASPRSTPPARIRSTTEVAPRSDALDRSSYLNVAGIPRLPTRATEQGRIATAVRTARRPRVELGLVRRSGPGWSGAPLDLQDQARRPPARGPGSPRGSARPTLRPRHSAPFTKTGPSGSSSPRVSPTSPTSPRWVEVRRSRDCTATVRPNPQYRRAPTDEATRSATARRRSRRPRRRRAAPSPPTNASSPGDRERSEPAAAGRRGSSGRSRAGAGRARPGRTATTVSP